jgi:nucleoside 2-deoxyribosyltransferase
MSVSSSTLNAETLQVIKEIHRVGLEMVYQFEDLQKPYIYLAGSASKDTDFRVKWRADAAKMLPSFKPLSPFREKPAAYDDTYTPGEIVDRDVDDIKRSRIVLAEMIFPDYNYIGTSMELVYAKQFQVPVVIWTDVPRIKNHYWNRYHSVKILPTLEKCCEYIEYFWRA